MNYLYRMFIVALLIFASLTNTAFAENITVSPAIIEQGVNPGTKYDFSINITNNNGGEGLFYADVQNIKTVTEFGEPIFSEDLSESTGFEMASWINIPSSYVKVGTGATKVLPFSVFVPKDATPGWHTAAVFISNKPNSVGKNNQSIIDYRTAVIISFRVSGAVLDELQINKFDTGGYIFSEPKVDFEVVLQNTGNALQRPIGAIEISDSSGQVVANININDKQSAVVPGSLRALKASWRGDNWSFGRYKASLALSYGFDNSYKTATRQNYFWVLPIKIILPALVTLAIITLGVFIFVRIYIRRKIKSIASAGSIKNANKVSRLVVMTLASLVFSIIFFIILFIIFS